jgi:hypothetical protein
VAIGYAVEGDGPPKDVLEIVCDGNKVYLRDPSGGAVTTSSEVFAAIHSDFAAMTDALTPKFQEPKGRVSPPAWAHGICRA